MEPDGQQPLHRLQAVRFKVRPIMQRIIGHERKWRLFLSFHQNTTPVVGRKVHRAAHRLGSMFTQPTAGMVQQLVCRSLVMRLKMAKEAHVVAVNLVMRRMARGADAPYHFALAISEKQRYLVLLQEGAGKRHKPPPFQKGYRRNIIGIALIKLALGIEEARWGSTGFDFNVPALARFGMV